MAEGDEELGARFLAALKDDEGNNPLSVVIGNLEMLAREMSGYPRIGERVEKMRGALDRIRDIVARMSRIMRVEMFAHSDTLPQMLDIRKSSATESDERRP